MDKLTDAILKDSSHQSLEHRGHCSHPSALLGSWMCQVLWWTLSYGCVLVWCIFVHMLWTYRVLSNMLPWLYHYKWYLGQGMGSCPWLCYHSVLINQKQYVVYHFSLVCRALAPLDVPLQVSTTVQWCISQFSERALHGNAMGISAADSGYAFWDQLDWSHGSPPG